LGDSNHELKLVEAKLSYQEVIMMNGFDCATCGAYHEEIPMCFGPPAPALWYAIPLNERSERCQLTSDQCVIDGKHFFVLGRIAFPVIDGSEGDDEFIWLAWVSLSQADFIRVSELWEHEGRESEEPYLGWLQSSLPYSSDTLNLRVRVQTMQVGVRPQIWIESTEHPLFLEQLLGIPMSRVQEIVEAALHG
jgi:hypothetical protein